MKQTNSDELDLGIVFNKIKDFTNKILVSIYHGIQFLIKNWWKLLILAVIGAITGHFLDKNQGPNKETVFIVQNNFESTDYVYIAVEQLNQKLKEKDINFLKEAGFRTDTIVIKSIEIAPIVNLIDLLTKARNADYRSLETFIENTDYKDELLTSELFIPEYSHHKVFVTTTSKASKKDIEHIINYLNSNEVFNTIKDIVKADTKVQIEEYKVTISKINEILGSQADKRSKEKESSQLLVSMGTAYTDLYQLVYSKNSTMSRILELESELTKYDNVVSLINKPVLVNSKETFGDKKIRYAFLFIFLYLFFFIMKGALKKIKRMSENLDVKG
jgi:hypothetical protein